MSEEWGPWIEHDGHGFPVAIGTEVHRVFDGIVDYLEGEPIPATNEFVGPLCEKELEIWLWCMPRWHPAGIIPRVIRYRVRKPKGLEQLQRIAAEPQDVRMPEPVEVPA